jgi:peptidoglycan/xylan/chitin deacetylase (PgdA/CDA1 family)
MEIKGKICALTFDDGPNLTVTPLVLNVLESFSVPATFFVVGDKITAENTVVMKRAVSLGCEIENHSWTHSHMADMDKEIIREEILKTSDAIEAAIGTRPRFFRPPYFETNEEMFRVAGMPLIGGTGCLDWEADVPAERRAGMVINQAQNGTIFLLHDFEGNEPTVKALKSIIPELLDKGFTFVTLADLFRIKKVKIEPSGKIWYSL